MATAIFKAVEDRTLLAMARAVRPLALRKLKFEDWRKDPSLALQEEHQSEADKLSRKFDLKKFSKDAETACQWIEGLSEAINLCHNSIDPDVVLIGEKWDAWASRNMPIGSRRAAQLRKTKPTPQLLRT